MNLTITFAHSDVVLSIEVSSDMSVGDLKAYAQEEAGFKASSKLMAFYESQPLKDTLTLQQAGLNDNSILLFSDVSDSSSTNVFSQQSSVSSQTAEGDSSSSEDTLSMQIEAARQQILYDPQLFAQLSEQSPGLADALHDSHQFQRAYRKLQQQQVKHRAENDEIDRNFRMAMDEMPEAFTTVTMLFANIEVNRVPVKAFIDSGAQTTIMSPECAERCKLSHLIDKRHRGMAYGVGQATILGKIHMAPIKIGTSYFACSITVIGGTNIEFLLGLDMLKHHQAVLDMKRNRLIMGSEELPFLSENEIPKNLVGPPGTAGSALVSKPGSSMPRVALNNLSGAVGNSSAGTHGNQSTTPSSSQPSSAQLSTSHQSSSQKQTGPDAHNLPGSLDPAAVSNLMSLGFEKPAVVKALNQANGNADIAAAILFEE